MTGTRLFRDTGHNKVQLRCHCYPLHVIMAKNNKELYKTHLSNFFAMLMCWERLTLMV